MGLDGTGSLKHSTTRAPLCGANKISCKIPSAAYTGQTVQLFGIIGFSYYYHMFYIILKKFVGLGYPPNMGLKFD